MIPGAPVLYGGAFFVPKDSRPVATCKLRPNIDLPDKHMVSFSGLCLEPGRISIFSCSRAAHA